ncbi:hypothetical protein [Litorilituus lipolyticus]|uniref:Uncharacterized protein n=1 Tax=Litorilituus lipolyticus TaxID=2491017 RepID=A0A502KVJ2_9GAMM|nr:hypothetical protein [Litorilituus lipolyticus]TPH14001.1 hypothetical protein EPA86_12895 [Litorilituus lipolyticus]
MNFRLIVIMSLMALPSSSFFLSGYLTRLIERDEQTVKQLDYALTLHNSAAYRYLVLNHREGSESWLFAQKELAKVDAKAALSLANWYNKQSQLLESLAPEKHSKNLQKMVFWLQQAVRLNDDEAKISLVEHYLKSESFDKAKVVLSQMPQETLFTVLLKIRLSVALGEQENTLALIKKNVRLLEQHIQGQTLLNKLKKFQVITHSAEIPEQLIAQNCTISLQLFATQLTHLDLLEQLVSDFMAKKISQSVCFTQIRYLSKQALECESKKNSAISCNEKLFNQIAATVNTRYIGVMLPEGGANVHFGILYFDKFDTPDVLSHEISHFFGFIDEYPLKENHEACLNIQQKPFARNVAVLSPTYQGERERVRAEVLKQLVWAKHIDPKTPILQAMPGAKKHWRLGTPKKYINKVGLFPARSCEQSKGQATGALQAYKPLAQRTHLEYYEHSLPPLYLSLLFQKPKHYLMPSFHWNIALAEYLSGNEEQANYWLSQSLKWQHKSDSKQVH